MREIKFRAMTNPPKDFADYHFVSKMVYGTAIFEDSVNTWLCSHDSAVPLALGMINEIVKPETVGQFTSLRDKNGKEIYEGDILDIWYPEPRAADLAQHHREPVIYRENAACFDTRFVEDWLRLDCEVIGNIHENPELLRKEQDK